jgi:Protein of unknown function (DUF1194)
MRGLLVTFVRIWFAAAPAHAAAALAIDVSSSVTPESYVLQRDGITRAFKDRRLLNAIAAAPGGIEALVSNGRIRTRSRSPSGGHASSMIAPPPALPRHFA